ncbi:hypothetical protein SCLCIDRAFT_855524 [Scleroderma citrinum Foug A]|uniref:Uncharacterized protein n=1 Tax=Scleroderma citrinum Foug A TaxID=1036808 RepID=A0A0C3D1Z2_9AGAM|nr:hypothetical protein SCLCIDRAFT_855524 [Scleroderma citrinum Foug A]
MQYGREPTYTTLKLFFLLLLRHDDSEVERVGGACERLDNNYSFSFIHRFESVACSPNPPTRDRRRCSSGAHIQVYLTPSGAAPTMTTATNVTASTAVNPNFHHPTPTATSAKVESHYCQPYFLHYRRCH